MLQLDTSQSIVQLGTRQLDALQLTSWRLCGLICYTLMDCNFNYSNWSCCNALQHNLQQLDQLQSDLLHLLQCDPPQHDLTPSAPGLGSSECLSVCVKAKGSVCVKAKGLLCAAGHMDQERQARPLHKLCQPPRHVCSLCSERGLHPS